MGLTHRPQNRAPVEWVERPRVDDLDVVAVLPGDDRGCLERAQDLPRGGDHGQVLARPLDVGDAERNDVVLLRDVAPDRVGHLVLDEDHRVGVPYRGLEEPLGVVRRRGHDHL